jgi:hypothetical protein
MNKFGRPLKPKNLSADGFYNSGGKYKTRINGIKEPACRLWENMKSRIYYLPKMNEGKFGKYSDQVICEDWKDYQNFAAWFEDATSKHYDKGWQLDKDLISTEKLYSPETCVFLPEEVNKALNIKSRARGEVCLGVSYSKDATKLYVQYACKHSDFAVRKWFSLDKLQEGFQMYKTARERYIKHLAEKYKDKLDPRAYAALVSYKITMED